MLKQSFFTFASLCILIGFTMLSCSKGNKAMEDTYWHVNDEVYQSNSKAGIIVNPRSGGTILIAQSERNDVVLLGFNNLTSGTFKVPNLTSNKTLDELMHLDPNNLKDLGELGNNECLIIVSNKNKNTLYLPIMANGGVVNISQSGKRFTATFNDIHLGEIIVSNQNTLDVKEVVVSGRVVQK